MNSQRMTRSRSRSRSPIPAHNFAPSYRRGGSGRSPSRSRSPPRHREYHGRSGSPAPYYRRYTQSPSHPPSSHYHHHHGSERGMGMGNGYYNRPPPSQFRSNFRPRPKAIVERGTDEDRTKSTTLYCGNLPYHFEERDVANMFERFGRIKSISVPIDRITRRNKGFAFVDFEQKLDAEDAFYKYNNYNIEGRTLRLDWDIGVDRKTHLKVPPPGRSRDDYRSSSDRNSLGGMGRGGEGGAGIGNNGRGGGSDNYRDRIERGDRDYNRESASLSRQKSPERSPFEQRSPMIAAVSSGNYR